MAYFFREVRGVIIFCGQRGEFAISFDGGNTWNQESLGDQVPAQHFYGENNRIMVIDQYVIALK